ncbi:hypothetical protein ACQZ4R_23610 [Agrobacterium vitis]
MDINDFLSFNGDPLKEGYKPDTVNYRPLDEEKLDEKSIKSLYELFRNYFMNHAVGFKWSAFYGYDLIGVLGVWHYCYAINFIEKFDTPQAKAYDEANINFLWQPPLVQHENIKEYFYAPIEAGENPALGEYGRLKESMRRNGEKPGALSGMSFDDLLKAADYIAEVRYYVQLGGVVNKYISTPAGLMALTLARKITGVAGVVWGQSDYLLGLIESALEDEIVKRIDSDPNDEIDEKYYRSRVKFLGLKKLKIEIGAN